VIFIKEEFVFGIIIPVIVNFTDMARADITTQESAQMIIAILEIIVIMFIINMNMVASLLNVKIME